MTADVLIDVNPALKAQTTGVGVYTGELIKHFDEQQPAGVNVGFYFNSRRRGHTGYLSSKLSSRQMKNGFESGVSYHCGVDMEWGRLGSRWVDLETWLLASSNRSRIFHATNILLPSLPRRMRSVVTIHDLLFSRFPHFETPYAQARWSERVSSAVKRADRVIAVSQSTANDLQTYYKLESDKISVIYEGVDQAEIKWIPLTEISPTRQRWGLPEKFLLFVGTQSVHKNLVHLVKAFTQLHDPEVGLVIVGKPGNQSTEIEELLQQCPRRDKVWRFGYLAQDQLEELYQLASLFVFPSLHEGFGLPVLEAMKRRLPVIASNNSSLGELFRDSAVLVDPHAPADIARAIDMLLSQPETRKALVEKGERAARSFTWNKMAEQTGEVYRSLL